MLTKFKEEEGMSLVELIVIISVLGFLMVVGFTKINEIVGGANEVVSEGNRYMESINDLTGDIEDHIAGIDSGVGISEDSTPEGEGIEETPFKIANYTDLTLIGEDDYPLDAHYELVANINASASMDEDYNNGNGFAPLGTFLGNFEGNGHTINDLYIGRSNEHYVGLFEKNEGTIQNLTLNNIDVTGLDYVGGLVGLNENTVENVFVLGNVSGNNYIGGLVGRNQDGTIKISCAAGDISGNDYIGGLVGHNQNYSTITNSYAAGDISGNDYIGGLVGYNQNHSTITNSYAAGDINGNNYIGGLVGRSNNTPTSSYWDTTTSQISSGAGTGKTTEEMYQQSTYVEWNFDNIWDIDEGNDYPKLQGQLN